MAPDTEVTIVVVPRERLSFIQRSVDNIFEHTPPPFNLIYVTGGLPLPLQRTLESEAERRAFRFIHSEHYLSPNQARNLALPHVTTKYVVFLDNDALLTRGWLEALLKCAEETKASIVGPLYLIGEFNRAIVHMAGGRLFLKDDGGDRVLWDEQYLFDTPISEAATRLRRRACDYMEFHCMLVRTEIFDRIGPMDEKLLSLHEERDICLAARQAGGSVFIEPRAVVSYVPPPPFEWWDIPYFMLRWSEFWTLESVRHFNHKWNIKEVRHISDAKNAYEEGSVVGFARAWRRRIAGVNVIPEDAQIRPDLPVDQARLMIALMQSVDREYFDVALMTEAGQFVDIVRALSPDALLPELPRFMEGAAKGLNLMIRPVRRDDSSPTLIRFDDLTQTALQRWAPHAFLILQTHSERYQCWLACEPNNRRVAVQRPVDSPRSAAAADTMEFAPLAGANYGRLPANRGPEISRCESSRALRDA